MKKAGVITIYSSQNYGAYLQAYAMQTYLNRKGVEVEFLRIPLKEMRAFLWSLKTKNIPLMLFKIRQAMKYKSSRSMINIGKHSNVKNLFDFVIIGSDTLWDVYNGTYDHSDFFLGYGVNAQKIIAYAPTCNNTTVEAFKMEYGDRAGFEKFTSIGVRDKKTSELVNSIAGIEPIIVADPTFLIDVASYPISNNIKVDGKYMLVYSYGFKDEEVQAIKSYCTQHGLKTVSVGLYNKWCDYNINANVEEFLGYMKKAECVVTSTFHGTIFSMLFNKRYATYARENYKVIDILEKTGRKYHNASCNDLDKILSYNDDKPYSDEFSNIIKLSQQFLDDAANI